MSKDNTQLEKELLKIVEHKTLEEHTAVKLIMNLFSSEVRSFWEKLEEPGYLLAGNNEYIPVSRNIIEAEKAKYE